RCNNLVGTYGDLKLIAKVLGEYRLDYSSKQPVRVTPYLSLRITDWSYHEAELLFGHANGVLVGHAPCSAWDLGETSPKLGSFLLFGRASLKDEKQFHPGHVGGFRNLFFFFCPTRVPPTRL